MARDAMNAPAARVVYTRPQLEPQVRRFDKTARKRLRKMAKGSPRFGDLLFSFPAAAYAVAMGRGSVFARQLGVGRIKDGAPLAAIADALNLPLWTRKLPPEAFQAPFEDVVDTPETAKALPGLAPSDPCALAAWFVWVNAAARWRDPSFALWVAKQRKFFGQAAGGDVAELKTNGFGLDALGLLAVYAFASIARETKIGRRIGRAWSPTASIGSISLRVRPWLVSVVDELCAEEPRMRAAWLKTQSVAGYKFAPRRTPAELTKEGRIMRNCVGTYDEDVRRGLCLIYAIRKGGVSVATMEIQPGEISGSARIAQLEAPDNQPAPPEIWDAARVWLSRQGPCPLRSRDGLSAGDIEPERWRGVWAPYLDRLAADRGLDPSALAAAPYEGPSLFAGEPGRKQEMRILAALRFLERVGSRC